MASGKKLKPAELLQRMRDTCKKIKCSYLRVNKYPVCAFCPHVTIKDGKLVIKD